MTTYIWSIYAQIKQIYAYSKESMRLSNFLFLILKNVLSFLTFRASCSYKSCSSKINKDASNIIDLTPDKKTFIYTKLWHHIHQIYRTLIFDIKILTPVEILHEIYRTMTPDIRNAGSSYTKLWYWMEKH